MQRLESILLVEDNAGDAALVKGAIQLLSSAVRIIHVETLHDALEHLQNDKPGLVMLDLHLPDSSGEDTFVRVLAKGGEVPVIVLTSADDETLALDAVSRGVQDYLVKGSITDRAIARSVRHSLERKRLELELERANETLEQRVKERTADLERSVILLGEEMASHVEAVSEGHDIPDHFSAIMGKSNQTDELIVVSSEGVVKHWGAQGATGVAPEQAVGKRLEDVLRQLWHSLE